MSSLTISYIFTICEAYSFTNFFNSSFSNFKPCESILTFTMFSAIELINSIFTILFNAFKSSVKDYYVVYWLVNDRRRVGNSLCKIYLCKFDSCYDIWTNYSLIVPIFKLFIIPNVFISNQFLFITPTEPYPKSLINNPSCLWQSFMLMTTLHA